MRTLVLATLLTFSVQAQEAARIAALVLEPAVDPAPLATALQSQEPRVRATAARVATVRNVTALVPALRTALESESDVEAASEQVRALALLGSDDDVAFAAAQSARFPAFVDEAFADGIARLGVPRALALYLRHRQSLRGAALSGTLPHWRTELHVMPTAARLLQARDAASFAALLRTLEASGRTLDAGIATIALASEDAAIRAAAEQHRAPRVAEAKPAAKGRVTTKATEIPTPSFRLPFALPRGLGAEILSETRCKSGWLGAAMVTTDHAGRVQDIDTSKVRAVGPCFDALRTIARLSLAVPTRLSVGTVAPLLVVRDSWTPPCFDQSLAPAAIAGSGGVTPPVVRNRVEPVFPAVALRKMKGAVQVEAEATISADGCVRDVRLLRQSPLAELNGSLVLALARWTFDPGTLNGVPVDVLFNLRTSFRTN